MKKSLLTLSAALFSAALSAAPAAPVAGAPEVKLLYSTIINDTKVDALSPSSLTLTPEGHYLVTFVNQGDAGPGSVTFISRSKDYGRTWSQPEQEFKPAHDRQGTCISLCNAPDGSIFKIENLLEYQYANLVPGKWGWRKSLIKLYRSTDGGKTFEFVEQLKSPQGSLAADMAKIYQLNNGDWVIPAYCYNGGCSPLKTGFGSGWFRSTDGGKTWGEFEVIFKDVPPEGEKPYGFNESAFVIRPDGLTVGFVRNDTRKPKTQFRALSSDNGHTWTLPEDTRFPNVDIPLITTLEDGKGYLMVGGNCGIYLRTVTFYWSKDGISWQKIGEAFYQPDNRHRPMNSATGGCQSIIKGPGKHQYFVAFYAHDPKLPGRHKTRVEGNMVELVFPEK